MGTKTEDRPAGNPFFFSALGCKSEVVAENIKLKPIKVNV
jgi:hypothetical protein